METTKENNSFSFFVGTYTTDASQGIYNYMLNKDGSIDSISLAAKSENPSFLTFSDDKKYLIAVNELEQGSVESYLITQDSLKFISRSNSGGAHPCYVSASKAGYVLAANYTGGNVGLLKLNKNGVLSDLLDVQEHTGKGTTERQQAPHAHSIRFDVSANKLISADLGTNELIFSSIDTTKSKLVGVSPYKLKMDEGAGPRHFEFHPNGKWLYVINELNSTITLVQKVNEDSYEKGPSVSTLPSDFKEENYCADIHISKDGKFIYASNRGHNSIAVFKVNETDGTLELIDHSPTHGKWPRNFSLSPDEEYLVVANQYTNNIVSLKRDKVTGLLKFVAEVHASVPVCILFTDRN